MFKSLVIQVDELWLKGKNRPHYFRTIERHMREVFFKTCQYKWKLRKEDHRFIAETPDFFSEEVLTALSFIPGVHSIIPARECLSEIGAISEWVISELTARLQKMQKDATLTFKIDTRRIDKAFPTPSMVIDKLVGEKVLEVLPQLRVDLRTPDVLVGIRLLKDKTYISCDKIIGVGGLPVPTSGRVLTLLSGGFDSPVAAYLMNKRGVGNTYLFFHAYPFVGDEVKEKIKSLVQKLARFQTVTTLYFFPFGQIQKSIADNCWEEYRTTIFRIMMVKAAGRFQDRIKTEAIVTGDVLGQVSSQTLGNLHIVDSFNDVSVLRPLLGLNKSEILAISKRIGTHDISIIPHDDACSMLAPKNPILSPKKSYLEGFFEEHLGKLLLQIDQQLDQGLERLDYDLQGKIIT